MNWVGWQASLRGAAEAPCRDEVRRQRDRELRHAEVSAITDEADLLVLDTLGLGDLWPAVLLANDHLLKVTGERPGTEREWPFPWKPGE